MSNTTSQTSARIVGLTMDARSREPGLDTSQIRQRFAPAITSAPHRLQDKAKVAPWSKSHFLSLEHLPTRLFQRARELYVAGSRDRVAGASRGGHKVVNYPRLPN